MDEKEKKDLLLEFFKWLDRRGMLDNTLCYDPEHQTETFIELRERKLPETWEEFCKNTPIKKGEAYTNSLGVQVLDANSANRRVEGDRNLLPDRETAEAVLALCQLVQLRECYNDGWQPNWREEDEDKYMIVIKGGEILTMAPLFSMAYSPLYFKTEELRDMFLNNFSELIEKIKPLYGIKKGGADE